jgi:hypothetical protein
MATNGSAIVSADFMPIETTDIALPDTLTAPDISSDPAISSIPGYSPSGVQGIDTSIDSTGDEGYVDSAGLLGGGNSTSSNNPDETCPAPGSPVSVPHTSSAGGGSLLEDLTRIAVAGTQIATAIEGPSGRTPIGRTGQTGTYYGTKQQTLFQRLFGQSAPVVGSKPSFFQTLLGTASGQTSGVNRASSSTGTAAAVSVLFIGAVVLGLGFLVWKAVR